MLDLQKTTHNVATWWERTRYENVWTIALDRHGSNTAPLQSRHWQNYAKCKRRPSQPGTKGILLSFPVIRSDSAEGNSFSDIMILRQITLKLVCKPWAQGDLLRGPLDQVLHGTTVLTIQHLVVRVARRVFVVNSVRINVFFFKKKKFFQGSRLL